VHEHEQDRDDRDVRDQIGAAADAHEPREVVCALGHHHRHGAGGEQHEHRHDVERQLVAPQEHEPADRGEPEQEDDADDHARRKM